MQNHQQPDSPAINAEAEALQVLAAMASSGNNDHHQYRGEGVVRHSLSSCSTNSSPLSAASTNTPIEQHQQLQDGSSDCSNNIQKIKRAGTSRDSPLSNSEDDDSGNASTGSSGSDNGVSKRTGLRKGKWTSEEEEYATRFIHYFSSGLLTLPSSKTLRASLAEKLRCDPMRITKKYAGASCLGNKISKLCGGNGNRPNFTVGDVEMARMEIGRLERRFHLRLAAGVGVPLPLDGVGCSGGAVDGGALPVIDNVAANATIQQVLHNPTVIQQQQSPGSFPQVRATSVPLLAAQHPVAVSSLLPNQNMAANSPAATNRVVLTAANTASAATTPASVTTYLAQLAAVQAQAVTLAQAQAASITAPNTALLAGVPQQHPGLAPVQAAVAAVHQQMKQQQHSQAMPPVAAVPAMSWPMMFPDLSQVGSVAAPAASPTAHDNDQLVQTLLLQITAQLQALATLSPITLRQVQLQILAATMTPVSPPTALPPAPQVPAVALGPTTTDAGNTAQATALLANFQLAAAAGQLSTGLPTTGLAANAGLLAALSANAGLVPNALSVNVAASGLVPHPLAQQQATAATSALLNPYAIGALGGVVPVGGATENGSLAVVPSPSSGQQLQGHLPQVQVPKVKSPQVQVSQVQVPQVKVKEPQVQAPQVKVKANQRSAPRRRKRTRPAAQKSTKFPAHTITPTPSAARPSSEAPPASAAASSQHTNMEMFLNKLRQGHAEALEKVQREQVEHQFRNNVRPANEGESNMTKTTSRAPSSLATNARPNPGPVTKKQNQDSSNTDTMDALRPYGHSTTVSSGSGCTTNDGSSSSSEDLVKCDENRNEGSTSSSNSNSLWEEDYVIEQEPQHPQEQQQQPTRRSYSVPLRKRFKAENNSGGITRRNLADHNFRMAWQEVQKRQEAQDTVVAAAASRNEMKNQNERDKKMSGR